MPAHIVLVFEEAGFADRGAAALVRLGHVPVAVADPLAALNLLEDGERVALLVSGEQFGAGKLHGVALARMARNRSPAPQVLVVGSPDLARYVDGLGAFMAAPVTEQQVAEKAITLLARETG
jgi:hypothetical protein